eukprot:TRINITY_DN5418_c0_g2_i12.p1 TRINITY_DN5418_c0_g2~~TRINITY_DN5418_c0_g2_i12.p1  ORF type:complete len:100 (+),score=11.45 TRINITY_DN5418_c0_g2_i12:3-302(+)
MSSAKDVITSLQYSVMHKLWEAVVSTQSTGVFSIPLVEFCISVKFYTLSDLTSLRCTCSTFYTKTAAASFLWRKFWINTYKLHLLEYEPNMNGSRCALR